MNDVMIFTFGQLDTFKAVLQAISSMFDPTNSEFFVSGDGIGAGAGALLASLLAILGLFSNYFQQAKVNGAGPLLGLIVYAMLCVPKVENVWLNDLYTGRVELVQNVPLGIATLGYAMSNISKNMIDIFELEYSQPGIIGGDDYLSSMTDGNGFLSPLKLMVSLRENVLTPAPYHLIFNVASYTKYCLFGKKDLGNPPYFTAAALRNNTDPLGYFLDANLYVNTFTETVNAVSGQVSLTDCDALNATLSSNGIGGVKFYLKNPATFGTYAFGTLMMANEAQADLCRGELSSGGTCDTKSTAITKSDNLLNAVFGTMNTNQRYMEVRLMQNITELTSVVGDMSSQSVNNIAITMTENIELARMQETIEGETFLHFMIPAMNAMTYLFYALFPLAMIIMVARGAGALMYLGGYMLFGLWVYSWIPVATVINFATIASVMDAFAVMSTQIPLTIDTNHYYIQQAMDAVAVGSNLLAATPVITLAIVSGSMFALTSVASSSANPSGASGEMAKQNTPSFHNSPSLVEGKSAYIATDSANGYAGAGSAHVSNLVSNRSMAASNTVESSLASANRLVSQTSAQVMSAVNDTYGQGHTVGKGVTAQNGSTTSMQAAASVKSAYQAAYSAIGESSEGLSLSKMSSVGGAILGGKGLMAGGQMNHSATTSEMQAQRETFTNAFTSALETSGGMGLVKQAAHSDMASNTKTGSANNIISSASNYADATSLASQKTNEAKASRSVQQSQKLTGMEVFNSMASQTGGESLNYQGNKDTFSAMVGGSATEHGYDGGQAEQFKDRLSDETEKVNNNDLHGEKTGLAAFESGMTAVSNLQRGAEEAGNFKEAAMWSDIGSDLAMGTLKQSYAGHQLNTDSNRLSTTANDISTATVESDVRTQNSANQAAVTSGGSKLASPDVLNNEEKQSFSSLGGKMDAQSNNWNSGGRGQNHFSEGYFGNDALNDASQQAFGKDFNDKGLDDTQRRQVMASQEVGALQDFASGVGQQISAGSEFSPEQSAQYGEQLQAMAGMFEQYGISAGENSHGAHSLGIIGQGELGGLTSMASSIVDKGPEMSEIARNDGLTEKSRVEAEMATNQGRADATNTGPLEWLSGNNSGSDDDKIPEAVGLANEASRKVDSGEMTKEQSNDWFTGQMDELYGDNGQSNWFNDNADNFVFDNANGDVNAFNDHVSTMLDNNHSPEVATALALDQAGYNVDGALQKGSEEALSMGTATALFSSGADDKVQSLADKDLKTDSNKLNLDSNKSSGVGKALKSMKGFGKASIPGMLAGVSLGAMEFFGEREGQHKQQHSVANNIIQDKITSTISGMTGENQQQVRDNFVNSMVDIGFAGNPSGGDEYKSALKAQSETGQYTNEQMGQVMNQISVNPSNDKGEPAISNTELVDLYNKTDKAPRI